MSLDPSARAMEGTDGNAVTAVLTLTALQNELILDKIFRFLPMKSLMCCSEVCKYWNKQARTNIRDNRKCTILIPLSSTWNHLKMLNEGIGKMMEVPFNSLKFCEQPQNNRFVPQNPDHRYEHPQDEATNGSFTFEILFTRMKLKYLSINSHAGVQKCPALLAICHLLLQKGNGIKDLSFEYVSSYMTDLFVEITKLDMLQLETVHIPPLYDDRSKDFFKKILCGNHPNLKKIINDDSRGIFQILPESKYGLLSNFYLTDSTTPDLNLEMLLALAQSQPTLSDLRIYMHESERDHQVSLQYLQMAASLLQSSVKSIEKLTVKTTCFFQEMLFPPLENLTFIRLISCPLFGHVGSSLESIEFGRLFPKLQTVQLLLCTEQGEEELQDLPRHRHPEFDSEEEVNHDCGPQNTSTTTSTLVVSGRILHLSFLQLRNNFPAVVDLSVMPWDRGAHVIPYRLIFRLWPKLRTLKVSPVVINANNVDKIINCDAEFCGINHEELELLWSMEEEYLTNVHIVPVRPCVFTMQDLEEIAIADVNFSIEPQPIGIQPSHKFLSSITKFLGFDRMPWITLDLKYMNSQYSECETMSLE